MNPELQQYIQKAREAGQTDEQIKKELLVAGWEEGIVNNTLYPPSNRSTKKKFKLSHILRGRISRKNYFFSQIILIAITIFLPLFSKLAERSESLLPALFYLFISLVISGFAFSLVVRRLHDIGLSWQWTWVVVIPIANLIFAIYLFFKKGEDGPNEWGDPVFDVGFVDAVFNLKNIYTAENRVVGVRSTPTLPSGYEEASADYKMRKFISLYFVFSFIGTILLFLIKDEFLGSFNGFIVFSFLLLRFSRATIDRKSPLWAEISLMIISIILLVLATWLMSAK